MWCTTYDRIRRLIDIDEQILQHIRWAIIVCQLIRISLSNQVYRDTLIQQPADEFVPTFHSCRTQMYRSRRRDMPPIPQTIAAIDLTGVWMNTLRGDQFVLHQHDDMIVFTTTDNLLALAECPVIFMDGTFKAAPSMFSQLFTIHGLYHDHVVSLVYTLMPDKRRATYHKLFVHCRFVRKLMALAFLPIVAVRPAFVSLEGSPLVQQEPTLTPLLTYYEDTWLGGSFPVRMWNVYADTIRTNNSVEDWHHKLNCNIGQSHPNVHKLVDVLRKEQASTETTIQQALLGVAPPPRRRKYRELDCRLQRVRLSYELGVYTTEAYLTAIQHIVHHYWTKLTWIVSTGHIWCHFPP